MSLEQEGTPHEVLIGMKDSQLNGILAFRESGIYLGTKIFFMIGSRDIYLCYVLKEHPPRERIKSIISLARARLA